MKKVQIISVMLLVAAMLFPTTAFSEGWFGKGGEHGCGGEQKEHREKGDLGARMAEELGLTAEQEKALASFRIDDRREKEAVGDQLREKRDELQAELEKDKIDQTKINKISGEMKVLMGKGMDRHIASLIQIKEVLTPEQFSKFLEISKKRGHKGMRGMKGSKGSRKE